MKSFILFIAVFFFEFFKVISSDRKGLEGLLFQEESETSISELMYRLYNSNNNNGSTINPNEKEIVMPLFIKGKPCVLITHGWSRNIDTNSVQDIVQAYLQYKNVNIIAIDWRDRAYGIYNVVVETAVPKVGAIVGHLIMKIIDSGLCSLESIHLIGHSLGAHVMGIAAKELQEKKALKIPRITGLDPAGPLFDYGTENLRRHLESLDADCVDIIHSDGGRFGVKRKSGHTDFYPNGGGPFQPGCNIIIQPFCAHMRAFQLYAESVMNSEAFPATECGSYNDYEAGLCNGNPIEYMGYPTNCSLHGDFYLKTGSKSPYSLENEV